MHTQTIAASKAATVVTGLMRRLAKVQAQRDRLEAELNARLDAVKGLYARRMDALDRSGSTVGAALERHCTSNRAELMPDGSKSFRTAYGRVGFRLQPLQVILSEGLDEEQVCRRLQDSGLDRLVRVRQGPDRAAIRKALQSGELQQARLQQCGVGLGGGQEAFFCMLDKVGIKDGARA